jgi:hypothetical protein
MITQTATTSFKADLLKGVHDFNTDTFKLALYVAEGWNWLGWKTRLKSISCTFRARAAFACPMVR